MKQTPMLYTGAMVCALLDDSKTKTRRIAKVTPDQCEDIGLFYAEHACPHGDPGDRLWVRETFFAFGRWETRYSEKKGRDEWHFIDMTRETGRAYAYAADGMPVGYAKHHGGRSGVTPTWWKRPAIFMPRWASRINLEITDVRVERLNDISEADAIVEGLERTAGGKQWRTYDPKWISEHGNPITEAGHNDPRIAYRWLWESINGAGSWAANPWVWAISFRRIK